MPCITIGYENHTIFFVHSRYWIILVRNVEFVPPSRPRADATPDATLWDPLLLQNKTNVATGHTKAISAGQPCDLYH